ncbi:AraC family transcriptional regulator [Micromonospora andamanensis]|uniref:AraC family transcriptional regulator n=1 Tax=Micromonospora andamanensis TaxID=1287068 RepID=A0ABQ4HMW1_9ACTN|nr:AraC family transcriptional regulator [Micromonospora andamanensis]
MQTAETIRDTRTVAPHERFDYWQEVVNHSIVPLEMYSDHRADFDAAFRAVDLGVARATRFWYPTVEAHRTSKLIRQSDPGLYQLALVLRGEASVVQGRRDTAVLVNQFGFHDFSRPSRMFHAVNRPSRAQPTVITLTIPGALLPVEGKKLPRHAIAMSGHQGIGGLLARHLGQLTGHCEQYRPSDLARLGTVTLDLLGALLAHYLDTSNMLPPESRDRVLLARVHAHIERHLGDPGLSPPSIAEAHHMSVRSLHRLFNRERTTVAAWIRDRRLERCRRDLASSLAAHRPINMIAARWGFTNAAHFSRAFRSVYDMSPHEYRRHRDDSLPAPWHGSSTA